MASLLVIVSKAVFEQDFDMHVGDLFETSEYQSKNKAIEAVAEGGSLFLVTARPDDQLWLIGILESPIFVGDRWTASANAVRIVDITERIDDFKFETGTGIKFNPGSLGMTLQAPRRLTDNDVAILRKAATKGAKPAEAAKPAPGGPKRR